MLGQEPKIELLRPNNNFVHHWDTERVHPINKFEYLKSMKDTVVVHKIHQQHHFVSLIVKYNVGHHIVRTTQQLVTQ